MKVLEFDWDDWNINKNEEKHGVSRLEAESAFFDPQINIFEDVKHSISEKRYIAYAQSLENRILMIGFTIRTNKVRIITARAASKKERSFYEKK